jgi:fimbrial chaperone protein
VQAALCGLLAAIVPFSSASAVTVTPVQVEMTSVGSSSRAVVTVVNDGAAALPIEAIIAPARGGGTARQVDTDSFLIIPPQALIPAGGTQNFRLQWLGDPVIAKSQNFMLYMNQVPVKRRPGKNDIQVVVSIGVMVNVAPPTGQPDLKITSSAVSIDRDGQRRPSITVENNSNVHGLLSRAAVTLRHGDWQVTIPPDAISQVDGIGLVPAGGRRTFALPAILPRSVDRFEATIDYGHK